MTKIASLTPKIPRGTHHRQGDQRQATDRGRTFFQMRIVRGLFRHARSRRVFNHEEPLLHPACDQVQ